MGSLGRLDISEPEDLTIGSRRLSISGDATKAVLDKGLQFPALTGTFRGDLPVDITQLDDDALGDLLGKIADYCSYVDVELAKADNARKESEAQWEFVQARVRLGLRTVKSFANDPGQKLTVKDKDDMVCTDPRVVEAKSRHLYTEAVYVLTKTILRKAERNWETVSRRITQRGQDVERMKRETNVANIPQPGHRFARR